MVKLILIVDERMHETKAFTTVVVIINTTNQFVYIFYIVIEIYLYFCFISASLYY